MDPEVRETCLGLAGNVLGLVGNIGGQLFAGGGGGLGGIGDFFGRIWPGWGGQTTVKGSITFEVDSDLAELGGYTGSSPMGGPSMAPQAVSGSVIMPGDYMWIYTLPHLFSFPSYWLHFSRAIKATVSIDPESIKNKNPKGTEIWDDLKWNCPNLNTPDKENYPNGLGGHGFVGLSANGECITQAAVTVMKGNTSLNITAEFNVIGVTPVTWYDTVLTTQKNLTLLPSSNQTGVTLNAGSTVRVRGTYGNNSLLVSNIGGGSWNNRFMSTGGVAKKLSDGTVYAKAAVSSNNLLDYQKEANVRYIYDYLIASGWTLQAISGVLGNIQRECEMNPGAWENLNVTTGSKSGYGIAQWTPSGTTFLSWASLDATSVNTMATNNPKQLLDKQLEYLLFSMQLTGGSNPHQGWYPTLAGPHFNKLPPNDNSVRNLTWNEFISSTKNPGDLAIAFNAIYLRSSDSGSNIQALRVNPANTWYTYLHNLSI